MKTNSLEATARDICRLLGIPRETLSDLAERGIIVKGSKRGCYLLKPSVARFCQHLRDQATAKGDEEAGVMRGELHHGRLADETVLVAGSERLWVAKLRNFRHHILGTRVGRIRSFQIYKRNGRYFTVYYD